jgi:Xaa-Pro aminopeptidase
MLDVTMIQKALRDFGLDGWLLYDFRGLNVLARRVLGLESRGLQSRRFLYVIPAEGQPRKLVHRIEMSALDTLPGEKRVYLRWQELEGGIAELVRGMKRVAMEYAPRVSNAYVSRVDAGTIEMVRSLGVEIVSSGDLVQLFESTWDDAQWQSHLEATVHTQSAYDVAWGLIAERTRSARPATELEVQAAIMDHFTRNGMTTYSPPIVAVGPHAGDPHFEPSAATDTPIALGSFVLIDLWAKMDRDRAVYSDLTRVGFVGLAVPDEYERVFQIVAQARDAAIATVLGAFSAGRPLPGWQVDDAARGVIESAGFGPYFIHRTGHNIGQEVHGNGAHMDNLETHEERLVLPRTCFSIEPGIYLEDFGVRSEVNVFIDAERRVHVTGGLQRRVRPILAGIPDDL